MIDHIVNHLKEKPICSLVFTGDLVVDVPNPDHWLSELKPILQSADTAIGHLEVPHTDRGVDQGFDVPASGAAPDNLRAICTAGFSALSMAGNHIGDCGAVGIEDSIKVMKGFGVAHAGAGKNMIAARTPAFVSAGKQQMALLSYNCVGPEESWATETRAGCAYLKIETADGSSVTPIAPLLAVSDDAKAILAEDIAKAKALSDIVVVALHKGIVHTPARLAPYERAVAQAAVDAGADIVVSHHAHIVRGIEFYKGKPIFHGLGNGCVVTEALSPGQDHAARAAWVEKRKKLFNFEPDPAFTLAPFHPEAVNSFLGLILVYEDGRMEVGILPMDVAAPGRPVQASKTRSSEIAAYLETITAAAGLPSLTVEAQKGWVRVS